MRKTRKCAFCGKKFTCNSGSQRYCSEHCAEAAKAQRKKRQQDFLKAVQPGIDIASQKYLTFSKAAILMGCSRQYVYKLVNEGKLPASLISSRMAFIRKADIEKMLASNPYHRVFSSTPTNKPCKTSSSLSSRKVNNYIPETGMRSSEPLEYISGEDVVAIYKVKKSWLYTSAKRTNIPMCKIAGKNYYSRKHMDALFGVTAEIEVLTEWLTTDESTMKVQRHESLGFYIFAKPKNQRERDYNERITEKAEALRCRRYESIVNERYDFFDREKEKGYFLSWLVSILSRKPFRFSLILWSR